MSVSSELRESAAVSPAEWLSRPDGARLALYRTASGAAPRVRVVMAHGYGASAQMWAVRAARLVSWDPSVEVVRYDQRGHGNSSAGRPRTWSMDLLAADLAHVLDNVGRDGVPVVLAGHSMGGMAVLRLAELRPHLFSDGLVQAVLLASTTARFRCGPLRHRSRSLAYRVGAVICQQAPGFSDWARSLRRPPRYYGRLPLPVLTGGYLAIHRHRVRDLSAILAVRAVRIMHARGDSVIPVEHGLDLAVALDEARNRHVRAEWLAHGGHSIPITHGTRVGDALQDLVRAVTGGVQHLPGGGPNPAPAARAAQVTAAA